MPHKKPEFETEDLLGTTIPINGTVGTVETLLPAVADKKIARVRIMCSVSNNNFNSFIRVFVDGNNSAWETLFPGEWVESAPRSNASNSPIKQIRIVGSGAGIAYEGQLDFEL